MCAVQTRNLDGVFEKISGAEYPTREAQQGAYTDIRPVGTGAGSYLEGVRRPASTNEPETLPGGGGVPQSDNPADIFNLLMVDSLKKAQGVNTADLYKKKRLLERTAISGQQELTPEELRTLSPAQQQAIRSGKTGALQPEFDAIAYEIKKAENAITNYQNVFDNVMKINADFAEKMVAPDAVIENYKKAVELDPSRLNGLLSTMNDATKKKFLDSIDWEKMTPAEEDEFQFIPGTANQESGVFNKTQGEFTQTPTATGTNDPITGVPTDASKVLTVGDRAYDFTSYATDPNWGNKVNNIMAQMPQFNTDEEMNAYIQNIAPGSVLRSEDINAVSQTTGIPPEILTAIVGLESNMGASNVAKQNNNFGGITWNGANGQKGTARPEAEGGNYVRYNTAREGIQAIANNIARREIDQTALETTGELTAKQKTEANKLAKDLYTASAIRTADGYENFVQPIIDRMKAGENIDEIADDLRIKGQSVEFTGDIRDAAQQITSDWSDKKTQLAFDKLDDLLEKDDIIKIQDQLKKLSRDGAGVDERRQVAGSERTIEFLDEIRGDLQALEDNGIDTNIFTGSIEKISGKIGAVNNPEIRKIATKIGTAIQKYRRAMSGVAFSVPESAEYKALFPNIDKTSGFNTANIEALTEVLNGDVDFFYSNAMGSEAYNNIFNTPLAEIPQEENNLSDEEAYKLYLEQQ